MGISTLRSYRGAKIFEAIGLSDELLRTYFGTPAGTVGGVHLDQIARDYANFTMRVMPPTMQIVNWKACFRMPACSAIARMVKACLES